MWDVRRWKIARQEFDQDVKGWDVSGQSVEEFYNVSGDMAQPQIVCQIEISPMKSMHYGQYPLQRSKRIEIWYKQTAGKYG